MNFLQNEGQKYNIFTVYPGNFHNEARITLQAKKLEICVYMV
jgi:hypothetical protein